MYSSKPTVSAFFVLTVLVGQCVFEPVQSVHIETGRAEGGTGSPVEDGHAGWPWPSADAGRLEEYFVHNSGELSTSIGNEASLFSPEDLNYYQDGEQNTDTVESVNVDVGEKLLLSPYIERGEIHAAQALSRVQGEPFPDHVTSYSGFLTIDKNFNSNLFFWFFPAETAPERAPVMLWLQGGPGDSSLIGLFNELGPFQIIDDNLTLAENVYSWHKYCSLIFIDNPVGAGFSFTENEEGFATNLEQVSNGLHVALMQLFQLFPEYQKNEFFIAGESYAGKFVPSLGQTIHRRNVNASVKINLQGIAVGNGFTDPLAMINLSDVVFHMGLIDLNERTKMKKLEQTAAQAILDNDYDNALIKGEDSISIFTNKSTFSYLYNAVIPYEPERDNWYAKFVATPRVRARLHVGNAEFFTLVGSDASGAILDHMRSDYMKSAKPMLEEVLDNYRVLYYSGQLDIIVAYPLSVNMYQNLQWSGAEAYRRAERKPWHVNDQLAGFKKSAGNFTEVLVMNAGHTVPADQPLWALELIRHFTSNKMAEL